MKRRDLIKTLRTMAQGAGVDFVLVRNGANHDIFRLHQVLIVVPRHNEINEMTARGIVKEARVHLEGGES